MNFCFHKMAPLRGQDVFPIVLVPHDCFLTTIQLLLQGFPVPHEWIRPISLASALFRFSGHRQNGTSFLTRICMLAPPSSNPDRVHVTPETSQASLTDCFLQNSYLPAWVPINNSSLRSASPFKGLSTYKLRQNNSTSLRQLGTFLPFPCFLEAWKDVTLVSLCNEFV